MYTYLPCLFVQRTPSFLVQCVPGLVVEQIDCHGNDGDVHDSNVKWLHINTRSLLATFMVSMFVYVCM